MIVLDNETRVFTLHTQNTTYQMKADENCVLLHTYYGPRIGGGDLSYLIQYADRGFCPNPSQVGQRRDYSLDTLPQEYSTCGVGDFRLPSAQVEQPGWRACPPSTARAAKPSPSFCGTPSPAWRRNFCMACLRNTT